MRDELHVYLVQPDLLWHDAAGNRERIERMLREDPPPAGSLVVLPETFASGFTNDVAEATDLPEGRTATWCEQICGEMGVWMIAGLVTHDAGGKGRNQAVTLSPAGEMGRYTKMRSFPLSGEHEHFTSGDEAAVFDLAGVKVAPLICYDLRFPELFRDGVARGAEVFVVIANWPAARIHHWHGLLRARAIENQAYVVGVNRTGSDPNVGYVGGSTVIDPDGRVLVSMDELPGVSSAVLDLAQLRDYRRRMPFLGDFLERREGQGRPGPERLAEAGARE